MTDRERNRWNALWERLGDGRGAPGKAYARLVERYSEPHRAYHTFDHVVACLAEAPRVTGNILHDLHTAVLMREHGIDEILTEDRDFLSFSWVTVVSL